jgi:hypothetical protein
MKTGREFLVLEISEDCPGSCKLWGRTRNVRLGLGLDGIRYATWIDF